MSARKPIGRTDHRTFCDTEGWSLVRDAKGRPVGHHITMEFAHPDGRTLRTRISRPVDGTEYGPKMERHILRDQLGVTATEFWSCVSDGVAPVRAIIAAPAETIPASIVRVLLTELHMTDDAVAALSRDQAITLANEHWSGGRGA